MTWLQKVINQFNRITSSNISEQSSEAEFIDQLESIEPNQTSLDNSSRISKLEEDFVSKIEFNQFKDSLAELKNSFEENQKSVQKSLKDLGDNANKVEKDLKKEINIIKSQKSIESDDVSVPGIEDQGNNTSQDSMEVDMKDILQGEIVPGLIN